MARPSQPRDKKDESTLHDDIEKSEARTLVGRRSFLSGITGVAAVGLGGVAGGNSATTPANQYTTTSPRAGLETDDGKQLIKLLPTDNAEDDQFGYSVSLDSDGETALIGAYTDDQNGTDSGSAYIFTKDEGEWTQTAKLAPNDEAEGALLGGSVALDDDGKIALVGAIDSDGSGTKSGAAYIFTKDEGKWSQTTKLIADGDQTIAFGLSVALDSDGETALIGASIDHDDRSYSGSAYIFTKDEGEWTQTAKLTSNDKSESDLFGSSVALDGDGETALIGDRHDAENGHNSGSVYIFTKDCDGWSQTVKLTPDDGNRDDQFGWSGALDIDGETALIGALQNQNERTNSGPAYIFTKDEGEWSQTTKITVGDGEPHENYRFGASVALDDRGETALIGAIFENHSGSAYIFTKTDEKWNQTTKITPDTRGNFGWSVSLDCDGETTLIGDPRTDENGDHSGSAYLFPRSS